MNTLFKLKTTLATCLLLALPLAQAATMARADFTAGKSRISDEYKADRSACASMSGNAKDVCVKEAKAVKTKTMADIKRGKKIEAANMSAEDTKRKADYKVAAEKCDAMTGDAKSACMASAKAKNGN